jgi:hypothetical protein
MKKDEKHDEKKECGKGKYKQMTDDEIKKFAEDIYKGLIFTDRNLRKEEDISMVFLPLVFMEKEHIEKLNENPPGMIYEYMKEAGSVGINGYPMFLSLRMVSVEDAKRIFEKYHKIEEAISNI